MKDVPNRKIIIPNQLWIETWLGLRERGGGRVESAAVWGGKRNGSEETVEAVYFLDDFEGGLQFSGYHRVSTKALEQLFVRLHRDRRVIVGDIHTHPTRWVGLSDLDERNPIEFRKGLYAIVLPRFAMPMPSLRSAGVHEYSGDGRWVTLSGELKETVFTFI